MTPTSGPHSDIATNAREAFLADLFDSLWQDYRRRVSYAATYEELVAECGATFINDHIAFRTLASQSPLCGISSLSRLFEALGYVCAGTYHFPVKQLSAIHFEHPNVRFPKLFISELKTWALEADVAERIDAVIQSHRAPLSRDTLSQLTRLEDDASNRDSLLALCRQTVLERPWSTPDKTTVERVNEASQYAAWVLVHGYAVNHFTALINAHGVSRLDSIDKTADALREAGVPMKPDIEGEVGSKLRQTATAAVLSDVAVTEDGQPSTMPWTYAYFELAQRGAAIDPSTGEASRFEGFLGPQATHLFEMTKREST